ncbi:AAA family ATPase [Glycomyces sp. NRRL B-16210]|uniref:AAA family ATPase n=1 Tax=Glycomyces sp. NRRL B-16210 TaxID=1463821 RepID=UPI00068DDFD5|nr:AAA family ATPase [Glycomyces sp. NRRL B-16210]
MPFHTASESASKVWKRGIELLDGGDLVRASDCFEHVLEYDPGAADAWLGIHACGNEQDTAVREMLKYRENVGRMRSATGLALESSFDIGMFVSHPLSSAYDAWLAYVAGLIDAERYDRAKEALDSASGHKPNDRTSFLRTRLCYSLNEWQKVLVAAQGIASPTLHDEAQFYVAASLVHLETHYEALNVVKGLPTALDDDYFDAHVAYIHGAALEPLGEKEKAMKAFQRAYRLAPRNAAFAARAQAPRPVGAEGPGDRRVLKSMPGMEEAIEDRAALLADAGRKLDAMIGIEPVKRQVNTLKAQFRMAALKMERGLQATNTPHHFVFTGPPGTGKTTVARIMGEILAGLGLLDHGRVVETQRGDLVGQYLGHTAIKTREKIDEATGGVLFIDEAYSLSNQGYSGDSDAFGDEAMQEILTAAENRRDRLVIILAGYTDEIRALLATNPGLKSRFSTVIDFPSYSVEELSAIAVVVLKAAGETLSAEAERSLREGFAQAVESGRIDDLGNGRFARELSRHACAQRDLRLLERYGDTGSPTTEEMTTIEAADIASAYGKLLT